MQLRTLIKLLMLAVVSIANQTLDAEDEGLEHDQLPDLSIGFPAGQRWSIASDWREGWPSGWRHASPSRTTRIGDWTIHDGQLQLDEGVWLLRDSVRPVREGLLECWRRWHWTGTQPIDHITLSVRIDVAGSDARPFLPAISYYDNPAGQTVDATRIPVIGNRPGSRGFFEEHRFPMPLVAIEAQRNGMLFSAALHSQPSPLRQGRYDDQWWSLGVEYLEEGHVELALLSGATASNGRDGVIKANQRSFVDYPDAYLSIPPDTIIEKRFYVQLEPCAERGDGFRPAVHTSIELFEPGDLSGFPALGDVIARKFQDTLARWHEDEQFAGFDAFPDTDRERAWIDLGWAGQSEAAAYPLLLLGEQYGIESAERMAHRATDFITESPFDENGFAIRYDYAEHTWLARRNPLSQAQAMNNMLDALRIARTRDTLDTSRWVAFLSRAAQYHAQRLMEADWNPVSTNEAFLIAPLVKSAQLLDDPTYLVAARKAADHYGARHRSMDEPYWGGTLDARCEDKEGAWAALQGFLAIYEVTEDPKYLAWAEHAADVVISYVYVWDVQLPPGRLTDHALKTRGWTSVSVQNMHLDVYGVLCAPALWKLGAWTDNRHYQDLARLMVVSCGQLVDAAGGQGEQLHQTNYAQHYPVTDDLRGVRGDYVESWNVFWITAHFLNAAAQFEELGVDWRSW